ncbi:MAG: 2-oxoglutarate dehydrogenase complex dihydrolipoyllysine-residue succinyltransferase, partial [Saprospiraceae bacterium]|nr:2-oxoglutarate dehydrogenase complex dihydrolipoyllysine-residue succinyltransferase [Saprospiraceae bacterium]
MSIVEMKVPTIGESITEVTLAQWLKEDGAYVKIDEPICEFESDKATLEFPAEASGILRHVAGEGDDLKIGALVAKIDTSAEPPGDGSGSDGSSQKKEEASHDAEADKATPSADKSAEDKEASNTQGDTGGHPSPAAAKILREHGISTDDVTGTGKDGRITKEDALKAVDAQSESVEEPSSGKAEPAAAPEPKSAPEKAQPAATTQPFSRNERRKKMSRMRRTIARRLVSAKNETAMLTTFNEVDLTEVLALRKKHQDAFVERYGVKLGFMSLFAKACAKALMEMPDVNAYLDGEELIYHDYVDISIAISTPTGLVVPPVKNVESLGFHEIELKIKELAEKAREGTLTLEEMQGGTFTITNGGIFGSMMSTPILNEPQSAILGMHNILRRPVAIDGEVVIRPMMYLALSYDHRVIDGSTSVTFL